MATSTRNKAKQEQPAPAAPVGPQMPLSMSHCHTDFYGNKYYEFKNDAAMTFKRFFTAQIHDRFLRLGLSEHFLKSTCELGLKIVFDKTKDDNQVRQDMAVIFQNIIQRVGYVADEDQFLRLACVYFVMEGEPLDYVDEFWSQKKIGLWKADAKTKDFFLQRAFVNTMQSTEVSLTDIKAFLAIATERQSNIPTLPKA